MVLAHGLAVVPGDTTVGLGEELEVVLLQPLEQTSLQED
jgi:hypothetical protein